ncbi:MAG: adenosylcobinamide-GDP ribazoletransferase, partial [Lachnospiraceae bacterium]|nr:adenosylcobinamide-GDP ribazoletransferase [Lachnospiraceae bacterium]
MKVLFETIAVAFSIFSAIPMPRFDWNEKNMKYMFLAFPLIGVVIGGLIFVWDSFCLWAGFPSILRGAGFLIIPLLVTGGIHLDGYVDTCDALASHGDHAKKQEILHDPHIGAFAAIRIAAYFALMLAVCTALPAVDGVRGYITVMLIFVLSRVLSGMWAVMCGQLTEKEDLLHVFVGYADKKKVGMVLITLDVLVVAALFALGGPGFLIAIVAQIVGIYYY